MANGNGKMTVIRLLAGFLWAVIFFAITFMGTNIIANDKLSRERDTCLEEKINKTQIETNQHISDIKEKQAVMLTHLEYLRNGRTNP